MCYEHNDALKTLSKGFDHEFSMTYHLPLLSAKAPPKGTLVLSPSQIDRWDQCKRWWAFQYIAGIRSPSHSSAVLGSLVHAHLESWLSSGIPPGSKLATERNGKPIEASRGMQAKAIQIAQRMIRHLPPPGIATTERSFYLTTQRGHHYTGFIDFSFDGRLYQIVDFPVPVVGDHKSTGNLKYAKTEADLHNDLQGVIYALAGFLGFEIEDLLLFWNYGTTKGRDPQTHPVKTRVTLPSVLEKFENVIEPVAEEILWHRRAKTDPLLFPLPPKLKACSAYGGCPHQKRCNISSQERFYMEQQDPNSTPDMAARMAQYPGNGAPPAGAPPMFAPPGQQFVPPPQVMQPAYPQQTPTQPQFAPPGAGQPAPMGQQVQYPPPGQPPQAQYPQQPAQPQFAPPAGYGQPQFTLPPGAPQTPQQVQLPFQASPQAAPPPAPPYNPEHVPNPPELGRTVVAGPSAAAAPPAAPGAEAPSKRKGRPAGSLNKEKPALGALTREQQVFIAGAQAAMSSINFNGNPAILAQGGELMLAAFNARYGKE